MYFKLGDYRVLERDIKYIKWDQKGRDNWSATICFRDGEEITVTFIPEDEKNKIEELWDADIERTTCRYGYFPNNAAKEEEE